MAGWITALTRGQWERGTKPFHNLSDSLWRWCHPLTQAVTSAAVTLDAWMHDITKWHISLSAAASPLSLLFLCLGPPLGLQSFAYSSAFLRWRASSTPSVCEDGGQEHEGTSLVCQGDSDKGRENTRSEIVGSGDLFFLVFIFFTINYYHYLVQ